METIEFFQQCAGKWFSQRTSHALPPEALEAGCSDLWIDFLPMNDPAVVELCQHGQVDPSLALCGIQTKWEGTVGANSDKEKGSALLVAIADVADPNTGQFLRRGSSLDDRPMTGQYLLNPDESVTLVTESALLQAEERLWFVSPNLRQRTSIVTHADGTSYASFCSEIRMGIK